MTPKEKAKNLLDKFYFDIDFDLVGMPNKKKMVAKQLVLIAVDFAIQYNDFNIEFLQEVKAEIEKL